jgi:ATP-dependent Clp protease protease subunit
MTPKRTPVVTSATKDGSPAWQDSPGAAGRPGTPGDPWMPGRPEVPRTPWAPQVPGAPEPATPVRVWLDPNAWQGQLNERLLERRIVMAAGVLDEEAATRLSAQLLTLDAEGDGLIRLEMQNLRADLSAALTVMGVLDVVRVPVRAQAGGEIRGAAIGVLAACPRRLAYPNASFTLAEPRLEIGGTATAVTERQRQAERILDSLYYRIAEATGRDSGDVREDFRRVRTLTTAQAIGYGLIHDRVDQRAE